MLQSRGREGISGRRWVMVIDLSKCRNARKCVEACQSAHHLRPYEYHINTLVMQESVNTPAYYMPKPCQHCDNPTCVSVCPVDATYKRQDGIVLIDNERCIQAHARAWHQTEGILPASRNRLFEFEEDEKREYLEDKA